MIGSFELKLKRNGRYIQLAFNNRVLTRGLSFHYDYKVNNANDSIISHLFLTGVHGAIDDSTNNSNISEAVGQAAYIDYIKPDFNNTANNLWVNTLVFRFIPTETVTVRQVGTGTLTPQGNPDYFSLANLVDGDGNNTELTLYPNDVLTVTYKVTFVTMQTATDTSIDWNILRSNPNWHLCGLGRRVQVIEPLMKLYYNKPNWTLDPVYWGDEYTGPGWVYRNITTAWDTKGETFTEEIYNNFISISGVMPRWINQTIGRVNQTRLRHTHRAEVRDIAAYMANFNPVNMPEDPVPVVTDLRYEWTTPVFSATNGNPTRKLYLKFKSSPLALVIVTVDGYICKPEGDRVGDGYSLTNKSGDYSVAIPKTIADGSKIKVYVLNKNGMGSSQEITYVYGNDVDVWMLSTTNADGTVPTGLTSVDLGWGFKRGFISGSIHMAVVRDTVPLGDTNWLAVASYNWSNGTIPTRVTVPVPAAADLFTSNFVLRIRYQRTPDTVYTIPMPQLLRGYDWHGWAPTASSPPPTGLPAGLGIIGDHVGIELNLTRIS